MILKKFSVLFLFLFSLLLACAGTGNSDNSGGMGDAPCTDCGARGEIQLQISEEHFYREWNPDAYHRIDSNAIVGVFPTLKIVAERPESCKMCHSFSADALDFDLARIEDSLFVKAFPQMQRELLLPGMRLPDEDSIYIDKVSKKILQEIFADGKTLEDFSPWVEREGIEQKLNRSFSVELKNLLKELASRYHVRYISAPIRLEVIMNPNLGSSGGYDWKILWSFWDARYGELFFLVYSEFRASTTSRVAPEKEWANPFAPRLWKMFSTDLNQIENH